MDKIRLVLNKIQNCIEMQNGATESQLKTIWNDLSDAISESELGQEFITGDRQLTIPDVNNLVCPTHGTKLYKHPNGMAYCSLCNYSFKWQTCC